MRQEDWSGNVPTIVETNSHLGDPAERKKAIRRNIETSTAIEYGGDPVEGFRASATRVFGESLGRDVTRVEAEILLAVACNRARVGGYLADDD